jgi:hypothetical protein
MKMSLTANQYLSLAFALTSVTLVAGAAHANSRYGDIHQDLSAPRVAAPQAPNLSDDGLNSVNAQTPGLRTLWHVRSTGQIGYKAYAEAPRVRSLSLSRSGYEAFAEAPAPISQSAQLLGPGSTNYGIESQR